MLSSLYFAHSLTPGFIPLLAVQGLSIFPCNYLWINNLTRCLLSSCFSSLAPASDAESHHDLHRKHQLRVPLSPVCASRGMTNFQVLLLDLRGAGSPSGCGSGGDLWKLLFFYPDLVEIQAPSTSLPSGTLQLSPSQPGCHRGNCWNTIPPQIRHLLGWEAAHGRKRDEAYVWGWWLSVC